MKKLSRLYNISNPCSIRNLGGFSKLGEEVTIHYISGTKTNAIDSVNILTYSNYVVANILECFSPMSIL